MGDTTDVNFPGDELRFQNRRARPPPSHYQDKRNMSRISSRACRLLGGNCYYLIKLINIITMFVVA